MNPKTIAEQLFFVTVKIDTITENGGNSSGTGFLFSYKKEGEEYQFIVSNKHVVEGSHTGRITFLGGNNEGPALGIRLEVEPKDWSSAWHGHPNPKVDIAILPVSGYRAEVWNQHKTSIFYRTIGTSLIPTISQLQDLDAIEQVTFIGYPNGLWDSKNFLPIARRGHSASPITIDFNEEPCFLIDASVFPGSSGSPVFVFNQGGWGDKDGNVVVGSRIYFIGVIAKTFYRIKNNEIVSAPIGIRNFVSQQESLNLGLVFKARTVIETIEAFFVKCGLEVPVPESAAPDPVTQS